MNFIRFFLGCIFGEIEEGRERKEKQGEMEREREILRETERVTHTHTQRQTCQLFVLKCQCHRSENGVIYQIFRITVTSGLKGKNLNVLNGLC